jgi:D-3-phosphoglycerate dehydrogenase
MPPRQVAVLSRSFSAHPQLRSELLARCPGARFNDSGRTLAGDDLLQFLAGSDAAVVALEKLDASTLARLPDLRIIGKYGVGLDNVDLAACQRLGIRVGWTGGVNRRSVAELTIAFMIDALRHVVQSNREILAGQFRQIQGRQLSGRTVGVVGCGHVGKEVVRLLRAFDCHVLVHDLAPDPVFCAETGAEASALDPLLSASDIVTLHLPLTPATRLLFDAERLARMRPGAVLVNTARGGIVDEPALAAALAEGRLGAAAFDVFLPEPPVDRSLIDLPNFIATGHIGGSSAEAVLAMGRAAIEGLFNAVDALDHLPPYLRDDPAS